MAAIRDEDLTGEHLIHKSLFPIVLLYILLSAAGLVFSFVSSFLLITFVTTISSTQLLMFQFILLGFGQFILIVTLTYSLLDWFNNYYIIKEARIIFKRGILATDEKSIEVTSIGAIEVSQTWLGRLFDFGTVFLDTKQGKLILANIPKPYLYAELMDELAKDKPIESLIKILRG